MKKHLRQVRHILCTFSGEDDVIIKRCSIGTQMTFANIGFLVIMIFIGCFISAVAFISELFQQSSQWISVPVGVIWAALSTNIYLLLLYTISPTLLPVARKKKGKGKVRHIHVEKDSPTIQKAIIRISMILRLSFISALAFIIAQPLNVMLLNNSVLDRIEDYKSEYKIEMLILSDSSLINQELNNKLSFLQSIQLKVSARDSVSILRNIKLIDDKVNSDVVFLQTSRGLMETLKSDLRLSVDVKDSLRDQLRLLVNTEISSDSQFLSSIDKIVFGSTNVNNEMMEYKNNLKSIISAKVSNHKNLDILLNKSNFYIKKIKYILSFTLSGWIISIIVICCFLFPILKKYLIRNNGEFYPLKSSFEHELVLSYYDDFKESYSVLFKTRLEEYNQKLEERILEQINKLPNSVVSQLSFSDEINYKRFKDKVFKYEFWADPPFRTIRRQFNKQYNTEDTLLRKLYDEEE